MAACIQLLLVLLINIINGQNTTADPTASPTKNPTIASTICVTIRNDTFSPTLEPTLEPTLDPTLEPTLQPTYVEEQVTAFNTTAAPTTIPTSAPIQSNKTTTYPLQNITGEYTLTHGIFTKPECNGKRKTFIVWMDDYWQIGLNKTNNGSFVVICNDTQFNDSSPVGCGNYLTEDWRQSFILISNGGCDVSECEKSETKRCLFGFCTDGWQFWVILSAIVIGGLCFLCGIGVVIWYCMTKGKRDEFVESNGNIARIVIDEDEDKVLIMNQEAADDRVVFDKFQVDEDEHKAMLEVQRNISISIGLQAD